MINGLCVKYQIETLGVAIVSIIERWDIHVFLGEKPCGRFALRVKLITEIFPYFRISSTFAAVANKIFLCLLT